MCLAIRHPALIKVTSYFYVLGFLLDDFKKVSRLRADFSCPQQPASSVMWAITDVYNLPYKAVSSGLPRKYGNLPHPSPVGGSAIFPSFMLRLRLYV